jgi:hypothetical protein
MQAGMSPMSLAQIPVIKAAYRGTDDEAKYLPR